MAIRLKERKFTFKRRFRGRRCRRRRRGILNSLMLICIVWVHTNYHGGIIYVWTGLLEMQTQIW